MKTYKETYNTAIIQDLQRSGYKHLKAYNYFVYDNAEFRYIFNPIITNWGYSLSVTIYAYIKFKKAEKILSLITANEQGITLGGSLDIIKNSPDGINVSLREDLSITITGEQDIMSAVELTLFAFSDLVKPFFEKFGNLAAVNNLYNKDPHQFPVVLFQSATNRCTKGLIISRLAEENRMDELVKAYDMIIADPKNYADRKEYNIVKAFVTTSSIYFP